MGAVLPYVKQQISAKLPVLQHRVKYKCVCVREGEGEKNAWGDEKG